MIHTIIVVAIAAIVSSDTSIEVMALLLCFFSLVLLEKINKFKKKFKKK